MDNYIAIVFDNDNKAYDGLHALWNLDSEGDVTIHGAAVIHRDKIGYVDVATKDTDPGLRTAIGVGIGALLGAGGVAGLTADLSKSGEQDQAAFESGFVLPRGKSAVIAEVTEQWTTPIDTMASRLGGSVFRRAKGDVRSDMWFDSDYPEYLYPYDYEPAYA